MELKSCPFCGGKGLYTWGPYCCDMGSGGHCVGCQGSCMVEVFGISEGEAVEAWNRRA